MRDCYGLLSDELKNKLWIEEWKRAWLERPSALQYPWKRVRNIEVDASRFECLVIAAFEQGSSALLWPVGDSDD